MTEQDILKRIHLLFEMELSNQFVLRKNVLTLKLANRTIVRINVNKIKEGKQNSEIEVNTSDACNKITHDNSSTNKQSKKTTKEKGD